LFFSACIFISSFIFRQGDGQVMLHCSLPVDAHALHFVLCRTLSGGFPQSVNAVWNPNGFHLIHAMPKGGSTVRAIISIIS
jgi:hypothetical protein